MAQYLEICKLSKLDKGESNKKKSIEIRNQTTFAGLSYLLQRRNVDPRLLGNVCNVIFPIGGDSESSEDVGGGEPHKESKHVKFFIKYIVVVFASGLQTDPVYLITDSNMREDEFHVREVKNLAVTESVGDKGYVVFTKTLLANKGFFLWFMKEIVLKAYDFNRQFYNLPCETHDAYLQVMSEAAECEPMFDMEMVQLLALRRMFVSKLPYATTSLNQLKVLLGPKGYFRRILPDSVFDNPPALKAISGVFDEHNTWLRTKKEQRENELFQQQGGDLTEEELQLLSPPLALWDPATIAVAKIALLRIQFANKMTVNQNSIKDSFFEAGIYPFSADRIFENGYTRVPPETVSHVKSCLDELNRILEARGEILEGDMDELHIEAPVTEKKYRTVDSSCLHRRRTVLLTHSIVLRRELEWRNRAKLAEQQPKKGSSGYVKKRTLQQMAAAAALESYGACDDVVEGREGTGAAAAAAAAAAAESGMGVSSAGSSVGSGLAALGMAALTHEPTAEDLAAAHSMVFTTV